FKTGIYELDENTVLAPLSYLQEVLNMDAAERIVGGGGIEIGPDGEPRQVPPKTVVEPARVTGILVLGVSADNPGALRDRCREICDAWAADHPREVPPRVEVSTWE